MIATNEGTKLTPKQAAAKMIYVAINSYNDKPVTEVSLYAEAGLDESLRTEREEGLIKVQIDKLTARVKKLLKVS